MKVLDYLKEVKPDGKFQLYDIIDKRQVYCTGYDTLIEELSKDGLEHVQNARFISHEVEDDYNIILYIKDIENYSNFELVQAAEKLYNKKEVF